MAEHIRNARVFISTKERTEIDLLRDALKSCDSLIDFYRNAFEENGRKLEAAMASLEAMKLSISGQSYDVGVEHGKKEVLRTLSDRALIQELTRRGIES